MSAETVMWLCLVTVPVLLGATVALGWLWLELRGYGPVIRICRRCLVVVASPDAEVPQELAPGDGVYRSVVCHDCRELDARAARLRASRPEVAA